MKLKNLRLKCILFLYPKYHLEADNLCDISCLKGCTIMTSSFKKKEYHYCRSDNGNDIYVAPLYVKLVSTSKGKEKLIRCGTEYFEMADELYQKVLVGDYIPIEKRKGINI